MKRLALLLFALAAAAVVLWRFAASDGDPAVPEFASAPGPAGPRDLAPAAPAASLESEEASAPAAAVERLAADSVEDPPADRGPRARVFGSVFDVGGRPLVGADVSLVTYQSWSGKEPEDGEALIESGASPWPEDERYVGFFTETDAAGAFELDVPVPGGTWTRLQIEPGRFHARFEQSLRDGEEHSPALREGERDLGRIVLADRGAVEGWIRSADGGPLADADVAVTPEAVQTISCEGTSDARGRYRVDHVPPGEWGVLARHPQHHQRFVRGLEAVVGEVVEGPELVLEPAEAVRGTVVDEQGRGIGGARVLIRQAPHGPGRYGNTDAAGAFELYLAASGPQVLSASLKGYEPSGKLPVDAARIGDPSAEPMRIVLEGAVRTEFVAVDDESGAPVEAFGLWVKQGNGSKSPRRSYTSMDSLPQVVAHEGGIQELDAEEGVDAFELFAPGYRVVRGDVEWDVGQPGRQTVRLERGAGLSGRVELQPGETLKLGLRRGQFGSAESAYSFDGGAAETPLPEDLGQFFHETFRENEIPVAVGVDGRFRVYGLEAGTFRLFGRSGAGRYLVVTVENLGADERRDLGELEPQDGGRIAGRVLVDEGVDPAGIGIVLDDWKDDRSALVDSTGEFVFEGLEPGPHRVIAGGRAGELAGSDPRWVQVPAGGSGSVELDLRGRGTVRLSLLLTDGGEPVVGAQVNLDFEDEEESGLAGRVGRTDDEGRVGRDVLPGRWAQVGFRARGTWYWLDEARVQFQAGQDVELELELPRGTLELSWPEGLDSEPQRIHRIELFGVGERPVASLRAMTSEGEIEDSAPSLTLLEAPRRWLVEGLPLGDYRLNWEVSDPNDRVTTTMPSGFLRSGPAVVHTHEAQISVTP